MNKGWVTTVIAIGIALILFFLTEYEGDISCSGRDYVNITDISYRAEVIDEEDSYGKVRITERLTFDIHAASRDNLFWELWRDLPEEYVDGVKVSYNVLSVKRLSINDRPSELVFEEASKLYWYDEDYVSTLDGLGPNRWYHSEGPYDNYRNFECVLFYVNGLYRETVEFELVYEMYNASLRYGDCSELYLSIYSGDTITKLNSLSATIAVPKNIMPREGNYIAGTFGTNSHTFDFSESISGDFYTFNFNLDKKQLKFRPYNKYVEFSLVSFGEDKHIFTQNAAQNYRYNDDVLDEIKNAQREYYDLPDTYMVYKTIVLIAMLCISALIIFLVILSDKRKRAKLALFKPTVDYPLYRDIPSDLDVNLAGALAFCKHKLSDDVPGALPAAMLSLVKKGFIETERIKENGSWDASNVRIVIVAVNKPQAFADLCANGCPPLSNTELQYYNLICRHAKQGVVNLKTLQSRVAEDYQYTHQFLKNTKNAVKNMGMAQGYFRQPNYKAPKKDATSKAVTLGVLGALVLLLANIISSRTRLDLAFGAFFVLGFALIASAILKQIFSSKYVLLTQLGEDEYAKWRGLYNFLNSETLINERTVLEVSIWEDYLIYATAFGISQKVIKALKVRMPDYDIANSRIVSHPFLCRMTFVHFYSHSFRSSTRSATWSSRTGGWGGYGGGGRGGGGGGGGH